VVAYTLPGEPPYDVILAFLNTRFHFLRQVKIAWSAIAGASGNAVVLFHPNIDAKGQASPSLSYIE